jgi:hypothetical protein
VDPTLDQKIRIRIVSIGPRHSAAGQGWNVGAQCLVAGLECDGSIGVSPLLQVTTLLENATRALDERFRTVEVRRKAGVTKLHSCVGLCVRD